MREIGEGSKVYLTLEYKRYIIIGEDNNTMINKIKNKNQIETKRIPGVTSWSTCRGVDVLLHLVFLLVFLLEVII